MTRGIRFLVLQLLLAVGLLLSGQMFSATVYSTQDGLWSNPETWGGTLPDLSADSIVIAHTVTLDLNVTAEAGARLRILDTGILNETGNKALGIDPGAVLYNAGEILIFKIDNGGTIYNTGLIDLEGNLTNHDGIIYNDQMIYVKNLLTQGGMLSGDGGQYMIWNNLNSTGETIATCTGAPINICNPDGITDPCNGPGQFDPECVMICGQLLSLEILSIEAKAYPDKGRIEVTWSTTAERGLSHFILERACAPLTVWAPVSPPIPALGNMEDGIYFYSFLDLHPMSGINVYRLACYDLDNQVDYSIMASTEAAWQVAVFPNPFGTSVEIYGEVSGYQILEVIDGRGQVLRTYRGEIPNRLELGFVENGWYTIRFSGSAGILNIPIVKF